MSFKPEIEHIITNILSSIQGSDTILTDKQRKLIIDAIHESYDTGYEEGLIDGEEITNKPISG